jgi:methionyl-tRNA synthetase
MFLQWVLNLEGNKLSTSKNWAVWLHEYLEEFESARCFALCFDIKCTGN